MLQKEPAVIITTITSAATALIGLVVAFGINVSDDQQKAILGFLGAFCTLLLVLGPVIRQFVYAPATVKQVKAESVKAGEVGGAAPVVP